MKVGSFRLDLYNPEIREVIILVLHQALRIEDQEPSFLWPNQLQENGTTVNDVLRSLPVGEVENPHSIYVLEEDVTIQLKVKGVMSGFDTRIPTQIKLDTCKHIILTNDSQWDPSGSDLENQ